MLVSRDPFARQELHRINVYDFGTCAWCGQSRVTKSGRKYLYCYSTETDGGRGYQESRMFCSKSCRDSFNS